MLLFEHYQTKFQSFINQEENVVVIEIAKDWIIW